MKTAIMQPYFFPYLGYFQLIFAVDLFIIYDNIQYTKQGWINRNRILRNGKAVTLSLPLKGASDYSDVRDRQISSDFDRDKLLNRIGAAYRKAPFFAGTYALIESILMQEENNLFRFLDHSLRRTCAHVGVSTQFRVSSGISIDHNKKKHDKVLALCRAVGTSTYINAIGGLQLYSSDEFFARGITLQFIKAKPCEYCQFGDTFVPMLSIIDVLMFNSIEQVRSFIMDGYELV
jgi:hypothetical protein